MSAVDEAARVAAEQHDLAVALWGTTSLSVGLLSIEDAELLAARAFAWLSDEVPA